jgi:hypothetical protein
VGKLLDKDVGTSSLTLLDKMDGIPDEELLFGTQFQLEELTANSQRFQ